MTSMGALTWAMSLSERGLRLDGVLQRLDERLPVAFSDIDSFGGGQQPLYQGSMPEGELPVRAEVLEEPQVEVHPGPLDDVPDLMGCQIDRWADHHELRDALSPPGGVPGGADEGAHRMPDHSERLPQPQRGDHPPDSGDMVGQGVIGPLRGRRLAEAKQVDGDAPVGALEQRDHVVKRHRPGGDTVQQQHRRALATFLVDVQHRDAAKPPHPTHRRGDPTRYARMGHRRIRGFSHGCRVRGGVRR